MDQIAAPHRGTVGRGEDAGSAHDAAGVVAGGCGVSHAASEWSGRLFSARCGCAGDAGIAFVRRQFSAAPRLIALAQREAVAFLDDAIRVHLQRAAQQQAEWRLATFAEDDVEEGARACHADVEHAQFLHEIGGGLRRDEFLHAEEWSVFF